MEKNDGIAVCIMRLDFPSSESHAVGSSDRDILKLGVKIGSNLSHGRFSFWWQWTAGRVEGSVCNEHAGYRAEYEVNGQE